MQPAGLANIKVFIRRLRGQHDFANRYVIALHDASLKYDLFPYPLENVTGLLDIQPDHWECQDFHGSHKGGEISVNGCSYRVPGEGWKAEGEGSNSPSTPHAPPSSPANARMRQGCHPRQKRAARSRV